MRIKSRLLKLEQLVNTRDGIRNLIVVIDNIITYENKKYSANEFYKLYPSYTDNKIIKIEFV